jgi:hypothetical protein
MSDDVKIFDGHVEGFDKEKPFYIVRFGDEEHAHQARVLTAWLEDSLALSVCATMGTDGKRHVFRSTESTETSCGESIPHGEVPDGPLCPKCFITS